MTTTSTTPMLGLIVPPSTDVVPVDGAILYGDRVRFVARGVGLPEMSTAGYDEVIDAVGERATLLAALGVRAISLMGTSLSFYRGAEFTDRLVVEMRRRTGLPCTTMSHAILRGLDALDIRRPAVATAYIDEVNDALVRFLAHHGIDCAAIEGLSIRRVDAVTEVPTATIVDLCRRVFRDARDADGILLSCGGLVTHDAIAIVEAELGVAVVSSSPAGFWDLMRTAGLDATSPAGGRLFAAEATEPAG